MIALKETNTAFIQELLLPFHELLGKELDAYQNHLFRLLQFCFAQHDFTKIEKEQLHIAAAFHDLGIWTAKTFDYLDPSIALATDYLQKKGQEDWQRTIELIIQYHHKFTPYTGQERQLVEMFRRADLIDISFGRLRFGVHKPFIKAVYNTYPLEGFHQHLWRLTQQHFKKSPLNPFPMLKW